MSHWQRTWILPNSYNNPTTAWVAVCRCRVNCHLPARAERTRPERRHTSTITAVIFHLLCCGNTKIRAKTPMQISGIKLTLIWLLHRMLKVIWINFKNPSILSFQSLPENILRNQKYMQVLSKAAAKSVGCFPQQYRHWHPSFDQGHLNRKNILLTTHSSKQNSTLWCVRKYWWHRWQMEIWQF